MSFFGPAVFYPDLSGYLICTSPFAQFDINSHFIIEKWVCVGAVVFVNVWSAYTLPV